MKFEAKQGVFEPLISTTGDAPQSGVGTLEVANQLVANQLAANPNPRNMRARWNVSD